MQGKTNCFYTALLISIKVVNSTRFTEIMSMKTATYSYSNSYLEAFKFRQNLHPSTTVAKENSIVQLCARTYKGSV